MIREEAFVEISARRAGRTCYDTGLQCAHCVRLCPVTLAAYIYSGRLSAGRSYPPVLVSVPWGSPGIHGAPGALFNDYTMGGLSTYRSSI